MKRTSSALAISLSLALFLVGYPLYVIRPFRSQGAHELEAALFVLRVRTPALVLLAALAIGLAILYRRSERRRIRRAFACLAAIGACLCAALSQVNVYEMMFHPMDQPSFVPLAQTTLGGDEKVLAIRPGGTARAYPIRSISYHHIVNDRLGAIPIVATY